MTWVFYCYGVRIGWGKPPFDRDGGLVFFQAPPAQGDRVFLHETHQPTIIQGVDHYRMAIDVTPMVDGSSWTACPESWA